jgi:hypothetical protein
MTYKSFHIDQFFNITKNGKPVFTAYWQRCETLQQAQAMIDNSIAAKAIFAKMPDKQRALQSLGVHSDAEQFDRWMNTQAEIEREDRV